MGLYDVQEYVWPKMRAKAVLLLNKTTYPTIQLSQQTQQILHTFIDDDGST